MLSYSPSAAALLRRLSTAQASHIATTAATIGVCTQHQARHRGTSTGGGGVNASKEGSSSSGSHDFASAVKQTLRTAATVSAEGASAFFKPQAESPLQALRPPAPPSASDAKPYFGQLNRSNRIPRYVNANTATTASASATASHDMNGGVATPAAAVVVAPMHMNKLLRKPIGNGGGSSSSSGGGGGSVATATATVNSTNPNRNYYNTNVNTTTTATSVKAPPPSEPISASKATVERAEAAIAAAKAKATATTTSSPSKGNTNGKSKSNNIGGYSPATTTSSGTHRQVYREHCTIGWRPDEFFGVVADVERYASFLPWCIDARVHETKRVKIPASVVKLRSPHYYDKVVLANINHSNISNITTVHGGCDGGGSSRSSSGSSDGELMVDAIEITATLWVGFSFFKEQYTSRVTILPGAHITAALADSSSDSKSSNDTAAVAEPDEGLLMSLFRKAGDATGVSAVKKSILKSLLCEWDFIPVPGRANAVEVAFSVSFEFKNPLHAKMIMNNIVALMTRSFERQCERLYGPPSAGKEVLPLGVI